jgi:hypothetical protein
MSRPAIGPTKPPIQWVLGTLSLAVKRLVREADHSPPSSAEVKNAWSYNSTRQYVFMAWCLVQHRDKFTFCVLMCINDHFETWGCFLVLSFCFIQWHEVRVQEAWTNCTVQNGRPTTLMTVFCALQVKVKLSLWFNWAPRHEGVLGNSVKCHFTPSFHYTHWHQLSNVTFRLRCFYYDLIKTAYRFS